MQHVLLFTIAARKFRDNMCQIFNKHLYPDAWWYQSIFFIESWNFIAGQEFVNNVVQTPRFPKD